MNSEQIILQARQLIDQGKSDFANKTNLEQYHFSYIEYFVVYDKAIKLLLDKGFISNYDNKIQMEYYNLIVEPTEFKAEKENFVNLYSQNVKLRLAAAKHFSKQARREGSIFRGFLFSFPKTFENLLPALKDEEPKVVTEITASIGCAYGRYFKDPRVIPEMCNLLFSDNKDILYSAIIWTRSFDNNEKWEQIFNLFQQKQSQKIIQVLCNHFNSETRSEMILKVQPILLNYLKQKINTETQSKIVNAIIRTLNTDTILNFKGLIDLKKHKTLANLFKKNIKTSYSQDKQVYLNKELFD